MIIVLDRRLESSDDLSLNSMPKQSSKRSPEPTPKPAEAPVCDEHLIHLDVVRQVKPDLLSMAQAQQMAELLSALADPNRLRLISALAHQELCVCDLAALLQMGESAVSHQLRVMRSQRLVNYRKEGRNVYYSLADHPVLKLYQALPM